MKSAAAIQATPEEYRHKINGTTLPQRTLRALETVDDMPPELRACVHEFGYAIVNACLQAGVTKPAQIRQLVYNIWQGARQPHQRTGERGTSIMEYLDWVLIQAGAQITAQRLVRVLHDKGMVVVPHEPTEQMIVTSMMAIEKMGLLTKRQKHTIRLRAAIRGAAKQFWPHLFGEKAK